MIGVSTLNGIYFYEPEMEYLVQMFKDKNHPDRINYLQFIEIVNKSKQVIFFFINICNIIIDVYKELLEGLI